MRNMKEKKPSIQVIERAALLLDSLAHQGGKPTTLKVLTAETDLHPSTAFRILSSLVDVGFVARDEAGRYELGYKLRQLGYQVRAYVDVRVEADPIMKALRDEVGETVNLTVREGDQMVYIERATPARMIRVEQVIGSRAPLHVTAVGKLMLAEMSAEEVEMYAERTGLQQFTSNTVKDLETLVSVIEEAHARGYALDNEEAEYGVGCLGVLVRDARGHAVAGLSISAPIERRRDEWIELLKHAGHRLSERLGYRKHG